MRLLSDAELLLVSGADSPPSLSQIDQDTGALVDGIESANWEAFADLFGVIIGRDLSTGPAGEIETTLANWKESPTGEWAQHSTDSVVQSWLNKLAQDISANPFTQAVQDDIKGLKDAAKADGAVDDEHQGDNGNGSGGTSGTYGGGGSSGGYTPPGTVTVYEPGDQGWS
jgi:hypothetical protein